MVQILLHGALRSDNYLLFSYIVDNVGLCIILLGL